MTWFDSAGDFLTDAAHVVERLTLIDPDTIHYQATIEDPNVFTGPWTIAAAVRRNKEPGFELLEESCREGESDLDHLRKHYEIFPGVKGKR
jgi:hypothetical protein